MRLLRNKRTTVAVARELYDATPHFVSLVGRPANQTPWREIRSQTPGASSMPKNTRARMAKTLPDVMDVVSISFRSENFPDADKVAGFLDANGYEGYEITTNDAGDFVVQGRSAEEFDGVTEVADVAPGVSYTIGVDVEDGQGSEERAADDGAGDDGAGVVVTEESEAAAEVEAVVAEAAAAVTRYDYYMAEVGKGKTLREVFADADDGIPPGMGEVNHAFYTALTNAVRMGDRGAITSITAEFGQYVTKLYDLFGPDGDTETRALIDVLAAPKAPAEAPAAAVSDADEPVVAEEARAATEGDDGSAGEPPAPEASNANDIAAAISAALGPMVADMRSAITALETSHSQTVKALADATTATRAEADEALAAVTERVAVVERSTAVRRSADANPDDDTSIEPKSRIARDDPDARMQRNILGMA